MGSAGRRSDCVPGAWRGVSGWGSHLVLGMFLQRSDFPSLRFLRAPRLWGSGTPGLRGSRTFGVPGLVGGGGLVGHVSAVSKSGGASGCCARAGMWSRVRGAESRAGEVTWCWGCSCNEVTFPSRDLCGLRDFGVPGPQDSGAPGHLGFLDSAVAASAVGGGVEVWGRQRLLRAGGDVVSGAWRGVSGWGTHLVLGMFLQRSDFPIPRPLRAPRLSRGSGPGTRDSGTPET